MFHLNRLLASSYNQSIGDWSSQTIHSLKIYYPSLYYYLVKTFAGRALPLLLMQQTKNQEIDTEHTMLHTEGHRFNAIKSLNISPKWFQNTQPMTGQKRWRIIELSVRDEYYTNRFDYCLRFDYYLRLNAGWWVRQKIICEVISYAHNNVCAHLSIFHNINQNKTLVAPLDWRKRLPESLLKKM